MTLKRLLWLLVWLLMIGLAILVIQSWMLHPMHFKL